MPSFGSPSSTTSSTSSSSSSFPINRLKKLMSMNRSTSSLSGNTNGGGIDPLNGAASIIENRVYYKAFTCDPKTLGSYTSIPSLQSNNSSKGKQFFNNAKNQSQQPFDESPSSPPPPQQQQQQQRKIHYFSIDSELVYWNFFLDFGPLNLGQLYRFCEKLNTKINNTHKNNHNNNSRIICFYSDATFAKRANAIFLISAWQILFLDKSPEEACAIFLPSMRCSDGSGIEMNGHGYVGNVNVNLSAMDMNLHHHQSHTTHTHTHTQHMNDTTMEQDDETRQNNLSPRSVASSSTTTTTMDGCTFAPIPPFHDASQCQNTYDLTILDCLRGLAKARHYNFFSFDDFDIREYEHFEQVENGDLNWIARNKFLAFAGPQYRRQVTREGCYTLTPSDYIPYFQRKNVGLVVRLNKKQYDENEFRNAGIDHYEKYYLDGSCPSIAILNKVLGAFEAVESGRAIAVHCKAGLGRTGTCIGAYLMKHYRFTAAEVIGWMRICRPGMVIGPQQHFLQDVEQKMWYEGDMMRMRPSQQQIMTHTSHSTHPTNNDTANNNNNNNNSKKGNRRKKNILPGIKSLSVGEFYDPESDAVKGRKGQADALLGRRAKQNQRDVRQD